MKVLRGDVRQRILDAARDEFLLNAYAGASMRAIAAQAGMTVGNIYLYFSGKEQLFDAIVQGCVEQLRALLQMSNASEESIRHLAGTLHDVFIQNRVDFVILISRSAGSKYESFKDMIVDVARRRMREMFPPEEAALSSPLAVAVIEGLLDIFDQYDGDEVGLSLDLLRFLNYMLRGMPAANGGIHHAKHH